MAIADNKPGEWHDFDRDGVPDHLDVCEFCGFGPMLPKSVTRHKSEAHPDEYQLLNDEWLKQHYEDDGLTLTQVGALLGVSATAVRTAIANSDAVHIRTPGPKGETQ